jgi:hypothetical protein
VRVVHQPTKWIIAAGAAAALAVASANAVAQNANPSAQPAPAQVKPAVPILPTGVWAAPVGHRQPSAADVAAGEKASKEERDANQAPRESIDTRLNICKGC